MKLFHDLVEREPNLDAESTGAVRETPQPNIPPPPVESIRETGTDSGNHGEEAAVLPDNSVLPVPSSGGVRQPKTASRQPRLPTRIQPARRAGRPDRYLALLLPYTICVLAFLGSVKVDALLVRDSVVFNEKPGVAFGESFWTVITDLDIRPAEAVVQTLKVRLKEYSEMAVKCRTTGNLQGASAAKKLDLTQCRQQFKEWKGSVAYLGENRWAFAAITAHEVVFSFPIGSSQGPPQSLFLPTFGVFEVPPGCTARTEDWVFPASLDGRLEASLDPLVAPTLTAVGFNVTTFKSIAVIELPKANATSINFMSDLLRRNDGARASSEMTGFQIQELMKKTTEEFQLTEPRYPFELLIMLLLLWLATTYLTYQTVCLSSRMRAHKQLDVPDDHFLPHLEQMAEV
ncbi:hypothetical protein GHT06_021669 [Daphnia sinensis]|uniref:Uncharacterized protein n=1 Tax=Daphnia sinensis TaxID=1820382 RepID=A0AAD5L123_9CRUS|nr:hypothetical protein GHT06_021669 [Daphnia sinensis]